jgi:hypothetical protein
LIPSISNHQRACARELLRALVRAVEEDRPLDDALAGLMGKERPVLVLFGVFLLGPIYFLFFGKQWEGLRFARCLRRTIAAMHDGEFLGGALQLHLKRWMPSRHARALELAERNGQLPEVLEVLAKQPPMDWQPNSGVLFYALNLYFVLFVTCKLEVRLMSYMHYDFGHSVTTSRLWEAVKHLAAGNFWTLPLLFIVLRMLWLRLPNWGAVGRLRVAEEATHCIAVMLAHGHDIIPAIRVSSEIVDSRRARRLLRDAAEQAPGGMPWQQALEESGVFDSFTLWSFGCAQATEAPGNAFARVAESQSLRRRHACVAQSGRRYIAGMVVLSLSAGGLACYLAKILILGTLGVYLEL